MASHGRQKTADLGVVSERVGNQLVAFNQLQKICDIQQEEDWAED